MTEFPRVSVCLQMCRAGEGGCHPEGKDSSPWWHVKESAEEGPPHDRTGIYEHKQVAWWCKVHTDTHTIQMMSPVPTNTQEAINEEIRFWLGRHIKCYWFEGVELSGDARWNKTHLSWISDAASAPVGTMSWVSPEQLFIVCLFCQQLQNSRTVIQERDRVIRDLEERVAFLEAEVRSLISYIL